MKLFEIARLVFCLAFLSLIISCGGGGSSPPVADLVLYVSTTGSDADDGATPATAKQTITGAIDVATNGAEIRVAGGNYDITSAINVINGVVLKGGYSADFSMRNPAANVTTVTNISNSAAVNVVFVFNDTNIDTATQVDGFTIDGGNSTTQSFGIDIIAGSPTIQNNVIKGGQGSGRTGIRIQGGSPVINNNVIQDCALGVFITLGTVSPSITNNKIMADTDTFTAGINATSLTGSTNILIEGNSIYGGDATGINNYAIGIWTSAATTIIRNNRVDAGSVSNPANGVTNAIRVSGGTATIINNLIYGGHGGKRSVGVEVYATANIFNNTIDGGSGVTSSAVYNDFSPTTALINNIFMTTGGTNRYCFYENTDPPVELQNNNFFNCTSAHYYDNDGTCNAGTSCTITEIQNAVPAIAYGNETFNPMFVDIDGVSNTSTNFADNDWHLTLAADAEILEGGQDLSAQFDEDFDGIVRTTGFGNISDLPANTGADGWSMGAYELDR